MAKARIATAWLGGCAGCHMSFLDLDEKLIDLAPVIDIVYGPLVDAKVYPENVDVAVIEGSVAAEEHRHLLKQIRERSKIVVALGDCAVTGNVPAMRNLVGKESALKRAYLDLPAAQPQIPGEVIAPLVDSVHPLHKEIKIDVFVPGCPPNAERILYVLAELLAGRVPKLQGKMGMFG
jgi:NAD-reducing hydrogenase small subunit